MSEGMEDLAMVTPVPPKQDNISSESLVINPSVWKKKRPSDVKKYKRDVPKHYRKTPPVFNVTPDSEGLVKIKVRGMAVVLRITCCNPSCRSETQP